MGRRCAVVLVVSVAIVVMALGGASDARAKSPTILWATTAKSLSIHESGSKYFVKLPADSPTVWFTDRPARRAGTTTLQGFVGGWQQNDFARTPPNAALILRRGDWTTQTVVVLTKPRELADGTIRFRARVLPTGEVGGMATMHREIPLGRYRNASLFVDAGDAPPCPAVITSPGWCTLTSSIDQSATTTVDLATPSRAGVTRTITSCYWKGDHGIAAELSYQDSVSTSGAAIPLKTSSLDKTTSKCNAPSFSNLADATWTFDPFNYYGYAGILAPRNHSIALTLSSRKQAYGFAWRTGSTPKAVIVVSDS